MSCLISGTWNAVCEELRGQNRCSQTPNSWPNLGQDRGAHREEIRHMNEVVEENCDEGHVGSHDNASGEYLFQFPAIWLRRWFDTILRDCHDGT